jgi:CRP-like cAMP-binding protein
MLQTSDLLRLQLASTDPYLRASAFYMIGSLDADTPDDRDRLLRDEHPLVVETAAAAVARASGEPPLESSTLEKMIGLAAIRVFSDLEPEDLAHLARAGAEAWYPQNQPLCTEGEVGDDLFVILDGEVSVTRATPAGPRLLSIEGAGSCIGELAVLDPAPREATVTASTVAVRALRLSGDAFREALASSPAVSEAVIRILARRLRQTADSPVVDEAHL